MSRRTMIALAVLAIVSIAVAGYAVWQSNHSSSLTVDQTLFPDLAAKADTIALIEITGNDHSITIARENKAWVLPQKDRYPADAARVGQLLSGMTHMVLVEKKTASPARYADLKLGTPGKDSGDGTEIKLIDAKGSILADAVIGRSAPSLGRVGGGYYARRTDQATSWLVQGAIDVPLVILEWAPRNLFDLSDASAIKTAKLTTTAKTILSVERAKPADETFSLTPTPPGKTDQGKALRLITLPVSLPIDDVTALSADDEQDNPDRTAIFKGFNGIEYSLAAYGSNKNTQVKISEKGPGDAVKRFNDLHAHWLYTLPPYRAELLKAGLADFSLKDQGK